jgi:hypothetical protein
MNAKGRALNLVHTSLATLYVEDDIIYIEYIVGVNVDLNGAKELFDAVSEFNKDGIKRPIFVDMRFLKSISGEARDYSSSEEACQCTSKVALWTQSALSNFIGNIFLKISEKPIPMKLFLDETKAIEWLKEV